ncbi:alpha/beta hydrolase [Varunaivibrio sulfuroxidans]|uniref:Phospholipase/carboxylesterase n=1 Tax=Varunaivibrio sulfuroxidans TaxID=1773489 RepID=A0A4R3J6Y7_9PROT|nr:dienelactone hydrolase family protein [Varunaivibrio sulfuroxidans]TCS61669.1 phospholipase/carboxylesterase [Varunaivibrio sulfuroxidans]WES32145.1 dienelactone hydrolase family protein [Varunaivibrio sulfuroxidans]
METLPQLSGPQYAPLNGEPARSLVIFLHGVGANGQDLIGLAPLFQRAVPDALFISPDAPFPFDLRGENARQWFSLQVLSPAGRLKGVREAAPILDAFIDQQLEKLGLDDTRLALVGFSQGAMMALHVGPRRKGRIAGILGYSGMVCGGDRLADETSARPPVLMVHGDDDAIVPPAAMEQTVEALQAAEFDVRAHMRPGLGHGIDEEGIRLGAAFLSDVLGGPTAQ